MTECARLCLNATVITNGIEFRKRSMMDARIIENGTAERETWWLRIAAFVQVGSKLLSAGASGSSRN